MLLGLSLDGWLVAQCLSIKGKHQSTAVCEWIYRIRSMNPYRTRGLSTGSIGLDHRDSIGLEYCLDLWD